MVKDIGSKSLGWVLFLGTAFVWLVSFLSGDHVEYVDALGYAMHGASFSRTFTGANSVMQWAEFVGGSQDYGSPVVFANQLYSLMLAAIYKAMGNVRLWYSSALGFVFYLLGSYCLIETVRRHVSKYGLAICVFAIFTTTYIWYTAVRPMTDVIFWALFMMVVWLSEKRVSPVVIGAVLGVATLCRIQGALAVVTVPFLVADDYSISGLVKASLKICLGLIPFLIVLVVIKKISAPGDTVQGEFYLTYVLNNVSKFDVVRFVGNIDVSIRSLASLDALKPLMWLAFPALLVFDSKSFEGRLAVFVFANIGLTIVACCVFWVPPTRYYVPYIPFVVFLAWRVSIELIDRIRPEAAGKLTVAVVVFFLATSSVGAVSLLRRIPQLSPSNIGRQGVVEFEQMLASISNDAIVATNNPSLVSLVFEGRHLVQLPRTPAHFVEAARRNKELDALILILKKDVNDRRQWEVAERASWLLELESDSLQDSQGNVFLKAFTQDTRRESRFVFLRKGKD